MSLGKRFVIPAVAIAILGGGCNALLDYGSLQKVEEKASQGDGGRPPPSSGSGGGGGGGDAAPTPSGDAAAVIEASANPNFCDNSVLCLRFDGADSHTGLKTVKGSGNIVTDQDQDFISSPHCLQANSKPSDYAGFQYSITPKFTATSVLTFHMALKVNYLSENITSLPSVGYVKIGGNLQINIAVKETTEQVIIIMTDLEASEYSRAPIATFKLEEWTNVDFTYDKNGFRVTPGGAVVQTIPFTASGDVATAIGITSYLASDTAGLSVRIDDVKITMTP